MISFELAGFLLGFSLGMGILHYVATGLEADFDRVNAKNKALRARLAGISGEQMNCTTHHICDCLKGWVEELEEKNTALKAEVERLRDEHTGLCADLTARGDEVTDLLDKNQSLRSLLRETQPAVLSFTS